MPHLQARSVNFAWLTNDISIDTGNGSASMIIKPASSALNHITEHIIFHPCYFSSIDQGLLSSCIIHCNDNSGFSQLQTHMPFDLLSRIFINNAHDTRNHTRHCWFNATRNVELKSSIEWSRVIFGTIEHGFAAQFTTISRNLLASIITVSEYRPCFLHTQIW